MRAAVAALLLLALAAAVPVPSAEAAPRELQARSVISLLSTYLGIDSLQSLVTWFLCDSFFATFAYSALGDALATALFDFLSQRFSPTYPLECV